MAHGDDTRPEGKKLRELMEARNQRDIGSIWNDQRKMANEDKRLEEELTKARTKAKELQRTLIKHKFGEQKGKTVELTKKGAAKATKTLRSGAKRFLSLPKPVSAGLLAVLVVIVAGAEFLSSRENKGILGENTETGVQDDGRIDAPPPFTPMYPAGKTGADLATVTRRTPSGEIIHTYGDSVNSIEIEVTQQEIPDNFDLVTVAANFYATNIIQVDDVIVYYGYSEQTGVQSLFFIKNEVLVSIRSTHALAEAQWATYISSLK